MKKILGYIGKHAPLMALSLLFALINVAMTLYIPILSGNAIDLLIGSGLVDFDGVLRIIARIIACAAVAAVSGWLMNICNNRVTYNVVYDVRRQAFEKISALPLSYIDSHPHGDIVSRVIADIDQFADGLLMGFSQLFTGVVTIIGTLVFMLSINAGITAVVVFVTPLSLFAAGFIAKKTYTMFKLQSVTRGEQTAFIEEMITNEKTIDAYLGQQNAAVEFDEINERLSRCSLRATFFSSLVNPVTRFVNNLVYAGVGITGAFIAISGGISVGQLSAFLSYANQYTKPFNEISGVVAELQNAMACADRVFEFIGETEESPDETDAADFSDNWDEAHAAGAAGAVDVRGVSFSYDSSRELIKNLNISAAPGRTTAIVGPTGCGKTTIINLLMRFYDVDEGSICVGGRDIREMPRKSLRGMYGMVLQDTWLKSGTIRENIAFGKPDASDEEIRAAAGTAMAEGFIKRLPDGYDTVIGEDGAGLSEGQKQLLCIARVMLKNPEMLILDEATSSIDTRTEAKVHAAFDSMTKGRTSFIVAHRLSTIKNADLILVMKDGRVIEQGTHRQLLGRNGFYTRLYNSQFAGSNSQFAGT